MNAADDTVSDAPTVVLGRVAASASRLEQLETRVSGWLEHRRDADTLEQYATQLDTISTVLADCTQEVAKTVPPVGLDVHDTYEQCRLADRRTVWVERVWRYFADRFDQRDGDRAAATCLRAADEVLWSCWRPAFATSEFDPRPPVPGPVPLPHLDAVHAPEAFPASLVPADLSAVHADAPFVRDHLQTMPVPTVRVPAAAVTDPWLLALVAHETGHHLQASAGLLKPFREAVRDAIRGAKGDEAAVDRWAGWSGEVFADLASVCMLGAWALWPIAELELRDPSRMTVERGAYPPASVRLQLLAEAVHALGLDASEAWPTGAPATGDLPDKAFVRAVVDAGLAVAPAHLDMADWIGLRVSDMAAEGPVKQWREWFAGGDLPTTNASLRAPRLVTAGVVAATADARRAPPPQRDAILTAIRNHAFDRIVSVRAPGRRAADEAEPVTADLALLGRTLAELGSDELDAGMEGRP